VFRQHALSLCVGALLLAGCSLLASLDDIRVGDGEVVDGSISDVSPDVAIDIGADAATRDAMADADAAAPSTLGMGLVAYWKLDGNGKDATDGGSDLVPSGSTAPTYPSSGKFGAALFPGLGSSYLCAECSALSSSTRSALEVDGAADFTIALWVRRFLSPNTDNTWYQYGLFDNGQTMIDVASTGPAPAPAYTTLTLLDGASVVASVKDATFNFRSAANTDVWTHLIAFRRGTTIGIRVNGSETTATTNGAVGSPAATFRLAQIGGGYPWQGLVDEVAKWDRALTALEMSALYNNGAGRPLP
jgi:hypothetical protein